MTGSCAGARTGASIIAVCLLLLVSCLLVSTSCATKKPELDTSTIEKLNTIVDGFMSRNGVPGAIVGIWIPGRGDWVATKGEADIESGVGMKEADLVRIGSITKSFTATLVLQLVDEGRLSLDGKLADFFSEIPNADAITIRQLLNHTSGIVDDYSDPYFLEKAADPRYEWTAEELIAVSTSPDDLSFAPGEGFHYSNTNYYILGAMVERVTGNALGEEMRMHIFEPLGLGSTFYPAYTSMPGEHAHGYIEVEGELADITESIDPSITGAAGAIISDLSDLKTWAKALATGELVSEPIQEERLQWVDVNPPEGTFLMGLGILWDHGLLGHNGEFSGFQGSAFYLPEEDATVIVLLNRMGTEETADMLLRELAAYLFPARFAGEEAGE